MILIGLLYLIFSTMTFINSKLMLGNPYPFFVGMLRAVGSGLFLLFYCKLVYKKAFLNFSLPKSAWKDLIVFGVFVHGFCMCGFSYAMQYTDPIKLCFMFALSPFVTMMLEYFLNKEQLTIKKVIGLTVGFLGLIPVLLDASHGAYKEVPFHLELLGAFVTFLSILFFAYGWIVMKRFLKSFSDSSIEMVNGIAMLIGGIVSFLLFIISSKGHIFSLTLSDDFGWLALAFVVSSLITYMLYPYLLKTYSATFMSFAGFLEPVFGLFIGVVFFGSQLTRLSLVSLAVLFLGLYIYYVEEMRIHHDKMKKNPNL